MRQKEYLWMLVLVTLLISMLSFISGGINWAYPKAGYNFTSNIVVQVTYVNGTDITSPVGNNTQFWYNTSGSYNSLTCSGGTANTTTYTCTIAITAIADASNIGLNVTLGNATDINATTKGNGILIGSITFDDTLPTVTATCNNRFVEYMERTSCSTTCSDNIDTAPAQTRTLRKPGGNTVSASTSPYTFSSGDLNELLVYDFGVLCQDYAKNNNTANSTFNVQTSEDEQVVLKEQEEQDKQRKAISGTNVTTFIIIGGAFIIIVVVGLGIMQNKKRKGRR